MVVVPCPVAEAYPAAVIEATLVNDDVHVAVCVRSCVLPSVYVPTASNACPVPSGIAAPLGVIAIDTKTVPVTVIVLLPEIVFDVARMLAVPCPAVVASP
jgi:hypothetical protein